MKKLLIFFVFISSFAMAQTPVTMYQVPDIAAMKVYYGSAKAMFVHGTNTLYFICSPCTADEVSVYAGAGGRKWKLWGVVADGTIINGSTNPVEGNAVYDALQTKQDVITLTTNGDSGPASFIGTVLNIPNYAGGGGMPSGTNRSVQFNDNGSFGGNDSLRWSGGNLRLNEADLRFDAATITNGIYFDRAGINKASIYLASTNAMQYRNSTSHLFLVAGTVRTEVSSSGLNVSGTGSFSSHLRLPEMAAPSTPPAGFGYLYPKTDGFWYAKDDAGVERSLSQAFTYTPTNSTDATYPNGTVTVDDNFLYYRTSSGTWKKIALATF